MLANSGLSHCDYVVSGIPFSILEKDKKREILTNTHSVLRSEPHSAFIIYQVTNELRTNGHAIISLVGKRILPDQSPPNVRDEVL